ncbi:3-oxoadipate CoA-transferase, partial [Rhodovulum sulfidophilum]|nr:3-oxoadipate CoA-transferase [Rhodovulum sulfidophilum]
FAMIRGRHLDLCVLGAYEVSASGDLANWARSSTDTAPAVGGAMDLAIGAKRVWVAMQHVTKDGTPRLVESCTYPLTSMSCVKRIFTDLAVIDVTPQGFAVREIIDGLGFDELQSMTGAPLIRQNAA